MQVKLPRGLRVLAVLVAIAVIATTGNSDAACLLPALVVVLPLLAGWFPAERLLLARIPSRRHRSRARPYRPIAQTLPHRSVPGRLAPRAPPALAAV